MNSCVLMAQIIQQPQLRYTPDNLEITDMMVQFPGTRETDPPGILKVVAWGNLAKDVQQNYHEGMSVIIIGRLIMNTIERPEGFKEKRAELRLQQIQALGSEPSLNSASSSTPSSYSSDKPSASYEAPLSQPLATANIKTFSSEEYDPPTSQNTTNFNKSSYPVANEHQDDDIPF